MNNVRHSITGTIPRPIGSNLSVTINSNWYKQSEIRSLLLIVSTKPGGYDKANLTFLT